jgi:predicted nucleic acid-binding protein
MAEIDSTVLIDSVIMIDHFNGVPAATEYLLRMQGKLAISVITFAEVLTGFEGKRAATREASARSLPNPDH